MFCYISVTIPDTVVKIITIICWLLNFSILTTLITDRGAIFGLRGPNAELPTGREMGWGSEFTGLRQ